MYIQSDDAGYFNDGLSIGFESVATLERLSADRPDIAERASELEQLLARTYTEDENEQRIPNPDMDLPDDSSSSGDSRIEGDMSDEEF